MNSKIAISGILLAVALLTFTGLAFEKVPLGRNQTITQEWTQTVVSHSPYMVTNALTSLATHSQSGDVITTYCYFFPTTRVGNCHTHFLSSGLFYWTDTFAIQPITEIRSTAIFYTQKVTSSITGGATKAVPAVEVVGLTAGSFGALAIAVISILTLVTLWSVLKPLSVKRRGQKRLRQVVKSSRSCVKCGADLPPDSTFCNKCGNDADKTRVY